MRSRFMRVILFFDLPMESYIEVKTYTKFRKFLLKEGFVMMQKSVYTKLALNQSNVNLIKAKINKNKPDKGLVQVLVITEKQFASIDYVIGKNTSNVVNSEERLIIL